MCCGPKMMGLFAIVPVSILLTITFFVLFAIRKTESQALKGFGYVVTTLLWLAALLILGTGIHATITGKHLMPPMGEKMNCPMMQGQMTTPPHQMQR